MVPQIESGVDVAEGEVGPGLSDLVDHGAARLAVAVVGASWVKAARKFSRARGEREEALPRRGKGFVSERWAGLAPAFPHRKRGVFPWTTNAASVAVSCGELPRSTIAHAAVGRPRPSRRRLSGRPARCARSVPRRSPMRRRCWTMRCPRSRRSAPSAVVSLRPPCVVPPIGCHSRGASAPADPLGRCAPFCRKGLKGP